MTGKKPGSKRSTKNELATQRAAAQLNIVELKKLWRESLKSTDQGFDAVKAALSGDDQLLAKSFLFWLERHIRKNSDLDADVRNYALGGFDRMASEGLPMGVAFGLDRTKKGGQPKRAGLAHAIIGLIKYLSDRGYALSEGDNSAFALAEKVLSVQGLNLTAQTLRVEYWNKKKKKGYSL